MTSSTEMQLFPEDRFEEILLEHIPGDVISDRAVLNQLYRILTPNGSLEIHTGSPCIDLLESEIKNSSFFESYHISKATPHNLEVLAKKMVPKT